MSVAPLIRQAQASDAASMIAVLQDAVERTWLPVISAEAANAFRSEDRAARYVSERSLDFWVCEVAGDVVGLVHWQADFIHALHVRGDYARKGVGSLLMDTAEAAVANVGHNAVRLETDTFNTASRAFYAARGYSEAGRYPDEEWNSELMTVLLVKSLT